MTWVPQGYPSFRAAYSGPESLAPQAHVEAALAFPSIFAFKAGKSEPYICEQRYFLRQTIGLGGGTEQIEGGANQLAGPAA